MKTNFEMNYISKQNFEFLKECAKNMAGIEIVSDKQYVIYARLHYKFSSLNVKDFDGYCRLLKQGNAEVVKSFMHAITTHTTSFFRENHHFNFLRDRYIPNLQKVHQKNKKLRVWSAGCASGEEPYSIIISILEAIQNINDWDIKVIATDVDNKMIEVAQDGIYTKESLRNIPRDIQGKYFLKNVNNKNLLKIQEKYKRYVDFKIHNLSNDLPPADIFDIVFCRNVLIYFTPECQENVLKMFTRSLKSSGILALGHSENLSGVRSKYITLGNTLYEKI